MKLISAALRHVRDAERLASPGPHTSPDQAYHLAGFGPECARKATLTGRWLDQAIGHGFGDGSDRILDMAAALDPRAARYNLAGFGAAYPALSGWDVGCRYEKTGARSSGDATVVCAEARAVVDSIVVSLWVDGHFPDGEEPG